IRVEQTQLLAAVNRIERVVDIQHDAFGNLLERGASRPWHVPCAAGCGYPVSSPAAKWSTANTVRRPRERGMRHFEHRIGAKTVGVVAVLVAGGDHQEAEADDVGESVRDLIWRTLVLDTACETIGDAQPLLDSRSIKTPPSDDNKPPSNFAWICR